MKKLLVVLALVGCGKSGGGGDSAPATPIQAAASTSMLVADKSSLPTCDTTRSGQLAYVKAESKFYGCDGSAWAEVAIKGEKGDTGAAGSAGSDNGIASTVYCHRQLTVNTGVDFTHYYIYYWASVTKSGDVFANLAVNNDAAGISDTQFYAKAQIGADKGNVDAVYDSYNTNNAGYWSVNVDRATLTGEIKYSDSELAGSLRLWALGSSDCTKTTY